MPTKNSPAVSAAPTNAVRKAFDARAAFFRAAAAGDASTIRRALAYAKARREAGL